MKVAMFKHLKNDILLATQAVIPKEKNNVNSVFFIHCLKFDLTLSHVFYLQRLKLHTKLLDQQ